MRIWPNRRENRAAGAVAAVEGRNQELLLLCHARDSHGLAAMQNLCSVLAFAKISFTVIDLSRRSPWPALDGFSAVVTCTERLHDIDADKARRLADHVAKGGGLLVAYRGFNEHLRGLFGIRSERLPRLETTSGLTMKREVFPGAKGLDLTGSELVAQLSRFDWTAEELDDGYAVLATDAQGMPAAWRRDLGAGRVVVWNTSLLLTRALRGFVAPAVLDAIGTGVAAAGGFAMFQVDDFPTSLSEARPEPAASEFPDLDWNGFIFDIWHHDMMALRREFGLRYSWYSILNYQDVDTGPDADPQSPAAASGADVLRRRFARIAETAPDDEYGLHGYNHEPLVTEHWPDAATLRAKLQMARALWEENVPAPLPTSWVPANNWYDPACLPVLSEAFPEISAVCGVHSVGEYDKGEFREFGPDPWLETMLCLPRQTYGYRMTPELEAMTLSQVAGMGCWTHFVHPDDLFDIPPGEGDRIYRRNPERRMWRADNADGRPGLYPELRRWIGHVRGLFPWIEFLTTSQAEERYRAHLDNAVEVSIGEDAIGITSERGGLFQVMTRAGQILRAEDGAELVDTREIEGGALATVRCRPGLARLAIVRS